MYGVEINTQVGKKQLDDPSFFQVFETLQELDLAVFVHPWDMAGTNNFWSQHIAYMPYLTHIAMKSIIEGGVLNRFPRLRVMFSHGGGNYLWQTTRSEAGKTARPNLFERQECYQTNGADNTALYFVDSNVFDPDNLEFIVKKIDGKGKVALGTDCPFPLGSAPSDSELKKVYSPQKIVEATKLDDEQKRDIYYKNALEWLNIT